MDTQYKIDIGVLKNLPLFKELEEKDISAILRQNDRIIRVEGFKSGDAIITEKRFDRRMFLMVKGRVLVSKEVMVKNTRASQEIITVEGSGHFLGEVTALTGKPRTASVTALEDTLCVVIDIALLMHTSTSTELLERVKRSFYPKLFELLCKRLEETDDSVVKLKQRVEDLEKRVGEVIKEKHQQREDYEAEISKKREQIKYLEEQLELGKRGFSARGI